MVFNPYEGVVVLAQVFDTYYESELLENFITEIEENNQIPAGFILIVACEDECTTSLSLESSRWLRKLGS